MTILQDLNDSPKLPADWEAAYTGKHPTEGGSYFIIKWEYPWTLRLANGATKIFKSYAAHHSFVREACLYYFKQQKRHISVL